MELVIEKKLKKDDIPFKKKEKKPRVFIIKLPNICTKPATENMRNPAKFTIIFNHKAPKELLIPKYGHSMLTESAFPAQAFLWMISAG